MAKNKYLVEEDVEVAQAGYSYTSAYDRECQKIYDEMDKYSDKSTYTTILLALFGLHRLTNGKIFTGLLYILTGGGMGIWLVIDVIYIASGKFTDQYGKPINSVKIIQLNGKLNDVKKRYGRR